MKKSTIVILVILLVGGAVMLFSANALLGPLQEDAEAAKRLARWGIERGDLREGAKVHLVRRKPTDERPGVGLWLDAEPSDTAIARPGGLDALVRALAVEVAGSYPPAGAGSIRWVEVKLIAPEREPLKTLLQRPEGGTFGEPEPPLPGVWPPSPATPKPPR